MESAFVVGYAGECDGFTEIYPDCDRMECRFDACRRFLRISDCVQTNSSSKVRRVCLNSSLFLDCDDRSARNSLDNDGSSRKKLEARISVGRCFGLSYSNIHFCLRVTRPTWNDAKLGHRGTVFVLVSERPICSGDDYYFHFYRNARQEVPK